MSSNGLVESWWGWITAISWQLALLVVLITLISRALPRRWSQLRHALWLLVLLKVFLPPGLTAPWSLGQWAVRRAVDSLSDGSPDAVGAPVEESAPAAEQSQTPSVAGNAPVTMEAVRSLSSPGFKNLAFLIWIGGAAGLAVLIAVQWLRLQARLRSASVVDEGPLRVVLEQTALELGLSRTPELLVAERIPSPFLVGLFRPRIVLPQRMAGMTAQELTPVLAHELAHWKRYDAWIGCLQVAVQVVFWFHPFVWWANSQLRQEREGACDDEVLQRTTLTPAEYGESLVQCLMASRGERLAAGHVLGVLERGANLQTRMEQIMAHRKSRRSFGITSSAVVAGCALLLFPMALHPPGATRVAAAEPAREAKSTAPSSVPPKPAALDMDAAAEELASKYGKAHPEVQEFVLQTMRSFGRSGLWLNENAYSELSPEQREARVAYLAKLLEESVYGRHLCSGLAEASALKDPKLIPGLKKVAGYHVDGVDYDCRAKWMAVAALARQESPDAVPVLISLVDHGNQNTRFWARAALARMAKEDFKDDKQAWNKWWVGQGHAAIDAAYLKPYTPPTQK